MGKIYTPQPIASETNFKLTLNNNLDDIETALDKVLSRDGETPNQMNADLDMNSNDILNVNNIDVQSLTIDGKELEGAVDVDAIYDYIDTQDTADRAYTDAEIVTALNTVNNTYLTKDGVVEVISGTSHTISDGDNGKIFWANNASTITITLPDDAAENLATGFQFILVQAGAGQVDFVTVGSGSILSKGSLISTSDQYAAVSCFKQSSNTWWLGGDLA